MCMYYYRRWNGLLFRKSIFLARTTHYTQSRLHALDQALMPPCKPEQSKCATSYHGQGNGSGHHDRLIKEPSNLPISLLESWKW